VASVSFDEVAKVYPDGTRAVSGFDLEISDGVVLFGARVVNLVPSRDRDIAMVFQCFALDRHLTVYDNIGFGLLL
jgi:multiple sugar transport system ATP-binding protein